jgi:hypothetical protein
MMEAPWSIVCPWVRRIALPASEITPNTLRGSGFGGEVVYALRDRLGRDR